MRKVFLTITSFLLISSLFADESLPKAPSFSLPGSDGKTYALDQFKGKWVVLEWFNPECPFVKKLYGEPHQKMQTLQKKYGDQGVIWLTINSGGPGKQGHMNKDETLEWQDKAKTHSTAFLIDKDGAVGKLYQAETTPHMFIITPKGELTYQGAIDSINSTSIEDIEKAKNYIDELLPLLLNDKSIPYHRTKAYGCSIKFP